MDVERIQKINSLALDLMKQGLASDREDAMIQAEKIFRNRGMESYDAFKDTLHKVQEETQPRMSTTSSATVTPSISDDQIKDILEKNTQFIVKALKEFQERLLAMEKDVSSVKNQMSSVRETARENAAQTVRPAVPSSSSSAAAGSSSTSHPRSGNYKEGDVSIEKFFYMGSK
ncbi:hypothetical protein HYX14_01380 [Candidatus Woesearchaeota archaeon]|nr:hypothetical protein [Candidatus Woesearchaeota archaeon]